MHHTIGRILSNPDDYIVCKGCGAINWYGRENCVQCGMEFTYIEFTYIDTSDYIKIIGAENLTEERLQHLLETYPDEDTEIDV